MKIVGIDPGYAITGYAVIDFDGTKRVLEDCGVIETSAKLDFPARLNKIYNDLGGLLAKYRPDCASVEDLFFQNNQKTAIKVAQARGIILLSLIRNDVKIFDFTPLEVKSSITGFGQAKKQQVILMTQKILNLTSPIHPDDAADACALALTLTFFNQRINIKTKK